MTPGERLKAAVFNAMEEAEMFGDLNAEERRRAVDYLDTLPAPVVAAIGRAFAKAAKEALR